MHEKVGNFVFQVAALHVSLAGSLHTTARAVLIVFAARDEGGLASPDAFGITLPKTELKKHRSFKPSFQRRHHPHALHVWG